MSGYRLPGFGGQPLTFTFDGKRYQGVIVKTRPLSTVRMVLRPLPTDLDPTA